MRSVERWTLSTPLAVPLDFTVLGAVTSPDNGRWPRGAHKFRVIEGAVPPALFVLVA